MTSTTNSNPVADALRPPWVPCDDLGHIFVDDTGDCMQAGCSVNFRDLVPEDVGIFGCQPPDHGIGEQAQ